MDTISTYIKDVVTWCQLFVDNAVLIGETRKQSKEKIEFWRKTLDSIGFTISGSKIEYMESKFSGS